MATSLRAPSAPASFLSLRVTPRAAPPPARARELESIQVLRALAATTVMFVHIPFLGWGSFGVDIFFVVSGFIISYVAALHSAHFFEKRLFRVLPLYWTGTLGVFLIGRLAPQLLGATSVTGLHLLKSLFFIPYLRYDGAVKPVLFLGWTLNYEMFFYLLFALALSLHRQRVYALALGLLGSIVALGEIFKPVGAVLKFYSMPVILEFACGIVAFLLWRRYKTALGRLPVAAACALSAGAYGWLLALDLKLLDRHGTFLRDLPPVALRGVPATLLFLCFLSLEGKWRFPKALLAIGNASYSLYLFHPYILETVDRELVPLKRGTPLTLAATAVAMVLCFGFADLSFRLLEQPSNAFLRKVFLSAKAGARPACGLS